LRKQDIHFTLRISDGCRRKIHHVPQHGGNHNRHDMLAAWQTATMPDS
jgi:hypothetical protein